MAGRSRVRLRPEITRYVILLGRVLVFRPRASDSVICLFRFHTLVNPHRPFNKISPSQYVRVQRLSSARKDHPYHWGELWHRQGEFHPHRSGRCGHQLNPITGNS